MNASAWTYITGSNNHYRKLDTRSDINDSVTVTIWGPTLNYFGLTGATYFSWTATLQTGQSTFVYWSGTGEDSFDITQAQAQAAAGVTGGIGLAVHVVPTDDNEYGAVLVQETH
jgi:hypothetical protein